jgi:hypothetical protein
MIGLFIKRGWFWELSSGSIDNYGKTPAFVTHVNIGY